MPSDPKRIGEVKRHIEQIKSGSYPAVVGNPKEYRIEERPWREMPERSKLAILQDAVDWSGVTNREQGHILLAEIDPSRITDAQRNRLIDMAVDKASHEKLLDQIASRTTARSKDRERER